MAKFQIYQDTKGEHRWRFISTNRRIMSDSAEGYINQLGAAEALERFKELATKAKVEVEDLK